MGYQDVIHVLWGYSITEEAIVGLKVLESRETPGLGEVPILVFERAAEARPSPTLDELARLAVTSRRSVDEDLVRFVEET